MLQSKTCTVGATLISVVAVVVLEVAVLLAVFEKDSNRIGAGQAFCQKTLPKWAFGKLP